MHYQWDLYYDWGNNDSAHYYMQKSVDLFEEYHPNHSECAMSLNNLGILYFVVGDFKAAEPDHIKINCCKIKINHLVLNNLGPN